MINNDIHMRNWMANCPSVMASTVAKDGRLEYGIYPSPMNLRFHENVLGEMIPDDIQQMNFMFTAKRYYNGTNANYSFFTDIVKWINQQSRDGNFPQINEGLVKSVVPDLNLYVSEPNRKEERCQIQIKVTYRTFQ